MTDNQFSVFYNGHPVAVTPLDNNVFMVQVTYKPIKIQLVEDTAGFSTWIEVESQQETYLSKQLGVLIREKTCS